jgi:hypothetical protein
VPDELADGIWVSQANADNANATADYMSFDVGTAAVTVYVAYDPAGAPPALITVPPTVFAPVALSSNLTVSDAAVGTFSLVEATNVTGTVTIGGTMSGGGAASQGYLVVVVP